MGVNLRLTVDRSDPDNFFTQPQDEAVARVMRTLDDVPLAECRACGRTFAMAEFDEVMRSETCACGGAVVVLL